MSLFGDEDRPASKSKSSLFDDDDNEPSAKPSRGSGLFAESPDDNDKSPWNFVTSKKQARGNLVKTLLPSSDVPESYIDAWDALLQSPDITAGAGVSLDTLKKILSTSNLDSEQSARILDILAPPGVNSFGRGEFNVLVALIGLAQEGDEASLDGVDDRRRRKKYLHDRLLKLLLTQCRPARALSALHRPTQSLDSGSRGRSQFKTQTSCANSGCQQRASLVNPKIPIHSATVLQLQRIRPVGKPCQRPKPCAPTRQRTKPASALQHVWRRS